MSSLVSALRALSTLPVVCTPIANVISKWKPHAGMQLLHTSAITPKDNSRRPRSTAPGTDSGASDKSIARRDSAKQMTSAANRSKWETTNQMKQQLADKQPQTNVYFAPDFETKYWDLSDSIQALREAAQPDMYDCMENSLKAKFTLSMRTKKKTKFIQRFEADTVLPHLLDFLPKRRVIALCKDDEEANACTQAGAFDAGSAALFSRLQHGAFHAEEYDGVVADSSWETTITQLRTILKDRLPTVKNGWLGSDVASLVTSFSNGVHLESTPLDGVPEIAYLNVTVGQLAWDNEWLRTNLQHYFDTIVGVASFRIVDDVILGVDLSCPPTGESFLLNVTPFLAAVPTRKSERSSRSNDQQTDDAQHLSSLDTLAATIEEEGGGAATIATSS